MADNALSRGGYQNFLMRQPDTADVTGTPFDTNSAIWRALGAGSTMPLNQPKVGPLENPNAESDYTWQRTPGSPYELPQWKQYVQDALGAPGVNELMTAANFIAPRPGAMALPTAPRRPRAIDPLGFYSHAVESAHALPQAKGTPEQMLAQLKKAGVKDAEISATRLDDLFAGKPSVTRDEITKHLEGNRVGLNEVTYAPLSRSNSSSGPSKWQENSLDPSNPTYRETVLHLPADKRAEAAVQERRELEKMRFKLENEGPWNRPELRDLNLKIKENNALQELDFRSGHFPEPNIVGHTMTSMTSHEGKPVHTIDQIQSDWGQKLRDGGARDEAKIAGLKRTLDDSESTVRRLHKMRDGDPTLTQKIDPSGFARYPEHLADPKIRAFSDELKSAYGDIHRLKAELETATTSPHGHPLVNTTDQWLRPTLHKSLMQAIDANADHIAIPSGKTVLSYNPGNEHGMGEFYDKIVPKNLHNILKKIDKNTPGPQRVEKLQTPGKGLAGDGFTLFPLTDEVKASVRQNGLPLFSSAAAALLAGGALQDSNPWDKPINRDDK